MIARGAYCFFTMILSTEVAGWYEFGFEKRLKILVNVVKKILMFAKYPQQLFLES